MDEMRAMLDDLMGKNRDVPLSEREKLRKFEYRTFSDKNICKYYLCGLCPYEEFRKSKQDLGECPKEHDDACKQEFQALNETQKARYGYEEDLQAFLDRLHRDLQKRIRSNTARIKSNKKVAYLAEDQAALDKISQHLEELLARTQVLGEKGDIDAAEMTMLEADFVKEERDALQRQADSRSGNNAAKGLQQTVCQVSGMIINDEEGGDHKSGRVYNAWKKIHAKRAELDEIMKNRLHQRSRNSRHVRDYNDRQSHRSRDRYPRKSRSVERFDREDDISVLEKNDAYLSERKDLDGEESPEEGEML